MTDFNEIIANTPKLPPLKKALDQERKKLIQQKLTLEYRKRGILRLLYVLGFIIAVITLYGVSFVFEPLVIAGVILTTGIMVMLGGVAILSPFTKKFVNSKII